MRKDPDPAWFDWLAPYFNTPGFKVLQERLKQQPADRVFPPVALRYAALAIPPEDVRVVILGQDPYHGPGQAMGLSFSVPEGVPVPPSLGNIYKEIGQSLNVPIRGRSGDLTPWAEQGVLLLNTSLSVESGKAASHSKWGWEEFTDGVIGELARRREGLVFMLWGKHAQSKARLIPSDRNHLVLQAPHPSPLSAHRGFLGCGHFSQANQFLIAQGKTPINW